MKNIDIKSESTLFEMADLFKNFSDSTRIKILYALLNKERTVNDIASSINVSQSAVSHQLKILKSSKLIKSRKNGKTIIYSLADKHVYNILAQGVEHVEEHYEQN